MTKLARWLTLLVLALVIFWGGALRFYGLNWDDSQHIHPDERYITWVATTIHWPANLNTWEGWLTAFDPKRSSFNPFCWPPQAAAYDVQTPRAQARSFAYGHLPLYLLAMAVNALVALTGQPGWQSYDTLTLVGRALSGWFDLGTLLVTFLLGRRVFGRAAGLLAAALLAFTPLHIQLAHFYAVDTLLTFFVTAALWLIVRYFQDGQLRDGLGAGACAGLAVGAKFTAIWLLIVLAALMLLQVWPSVQRRHWAALKPLAGMLAAAAAAFAVTNPFALIEARTFWVEVASQGAMARGSLDWPYTRQYHDTLPYLYHISQMARFSLGPALGLAGWGGLAWALQRAWRQTVRLEELALLVWTVSFFALTGGLYVKFVRYMLPIVPALAIYAAAILTKALTDLSWLGKKMRPLGITLTVITLTITALYGWACARVYAGEHPWRAASRWIYANVPAGSFLVVEHWDDRLPLYIDVQGQPRDRSVYNYAETQPYSEPDSPAKLQAMLLDLAGGDYVVLPSHRLWGTIPRWAERYPLTTRYYQALFDGRLGYRLEFFAARYPDLGPLTLMDQPMAGLPLRIPPPLRDWKPSPIVIALGRADESLTVYDRPLTLIFRNVARLSPDQMLARVTGQE